MKNANLVSTIAVWLKLAGLCLLASGLVGCGKREGADSTGAVKAVQDYFPLKVGNVSVQAQFAVYNHEMQQGLMYRKDLSENQGMLFVYQQPQAMGFYMKNTPTPLDIGFFTADGVLREVYQMLPYDERTVASVGKKMQFALEMNRGWFSANGVRPGAKLDLAGVASALKARGFKLSQFGLEPDKNN